MSYDNNKILLIDGEKDIVDLIEEALQQDSFASIEKAYTGKDAIRICREYRPDVIVLDVYLFFTQYEKGELFYT